MPGYLHDYDKLSSLRERKREREKERERDGRWFIIYPCKTVGKSQVTKIITELEKTKIK